MAKRTVGEIEREKRAQRNEADLHIEPKFWDGKSWRYPHEGENPYKEETEVADSDKSDNDSDPSTDGADETTITDSDGVTWHDVG